MVDCTNCELARERSRIVKGDGPLDAKIIFIGEGPGEQEDRLGKPFVGRAGDLLEDTIQALGLERKKVYITNVVCCRPPENRSPKKAEIRACARRLDKELKTLTNARLIIALGDTAARTILARCFPALTFKRLEDVIGKRYEMVMPIRCAVMAVYHPAFILRRRSKENETKWVNTLRAGIQWIRHKRKRLKRSA
jgi:DNA polymerase